MKIPLCPYFQVLVTNPTPEFKEKIIIKNIKKTEIET